MLIFNFTIDMLKNFKLTRIFIQRRNVYQEVKKQEKLIKAEDLVRKWRSLLYPREACGSRSYALLGNNFATFRVYL